MPPFYSPIQVGLPAASFCACTPLSLVSAPGFHFVQHLDALSGCVRVADWPSYRSKIEYQLDRQEPTNLAHPRSFLQSRKSSKNVGGCVHDIYTFLRKSAGFLCNTSRPLAMTQVRWDTLHEHGTYLWYTAHTPALRVNSVVSEAVKRKRLPQAQPWLLCPTRGRAGSGTGI